MTNRPTPPAPRLLALLLWPLMIAGCGESGPSLVKVDGAVILNGKPVEGALVSFQPDPSDPQACPAEGLTGPNGNYRAMTGGRAGVVSGKYHIVVTKFSGPSRAGAKDPLSEEDPAMARFTSGLATPRAKKQGGTIEASYDRQVPPEGGVFDFEIEAKVVPAK